MMHPNDFTMFVEINSKRMKERRRKIKEKFMIYADVFSNNEKVFVDKSLTTDTYTIGSIKVLLCAEH